MQTAIVGLAGAGKTTVFNTLTRGHAETGGFGGMQLNVGVVKVPDERLTKLADVFKPKKVVHADVTYVDLPAPPASSERHVGTEELPPEHLARLRDADALVHVVRAFDDPSFPPPAGAVDPARDIEQLDLEFVLADLALVARRRGVLGRGGLAGSGLEPGDGARVRPAGWKLVPDGRARRGPRLASARWVARGRCSGRDPYRPGPRIHPRRNRRLRRSRHAGVDGRSAQGRPASVGGQDVPRPRRRRAGDPLQPLRLAAVSSSATSGPGRVWREW